MKRSKEKSFGYWEKAIVVEQCIANDYYTKAALILSFLF